MKNTLLKYFRHMWKYADWSVVTLRISVTFFKYRRFFAFFREDGKSDFQTKSLKLARRILANISAFSLTIFVGISVSWHALDVSYFKISLRISSLFIFEKENGTLECLLHTSPVVSMLEQFLYFTTHFKTGSPILLA